MPPTTEADNAIAGTMLLCCVVPLVLLLVVVVVYTLYQRRRTRQRLAVLSTAAKVGLRDQWLATVASIPYRSELEVEVKFVAPLVEYLGFSPSQVDLRVPVSVPVGREMRSGVADWVLWSPDRGRPLIVVEAKAPGQPLNGSVHSQARSYAFALGAPMFLIANGRRLQLYRRGVESDECLVDCAVNDLAARWQATPAS